MQPLTIFCIVIAYATRSHAFPSDDSETDPRALEFNVDIKGYPGSITTTTEESLLGKIAGSISQAYDNVKDMIVGSEESGKQAKPLYPTRYVVHYPHLHPLLPSFLVHRQLPATNLRKPIDPSFTWDRNIAKPNAPEEAEEKENNLKVHYFKNNVGRFVAKELPESDEEEHPENAANHKGKYFHYHLQGFVQNSSTLPSELLHNTAKLY